jgi:protein-export membrane protein SecD
MSRYRTWSVILIVVAALLAWFVYASQKPGARFNFKLGLDLAGGTELVYKADVSQVAEGEVKAALDTLKDVIERRVNLFGVSEPIVQLQGVGTFSSDNKLIVDLPGVTDVKKAIDLIGQTPTLDFRIVGQIPSTTPGTTTLAYLPTGLTGRYLSKATLQFNQQTNQPIVSLQFNDEGAKMFAKITRENVGRVVGIFLDNEVISAPVVQQEITGGQAQISGQFTVPQANVLVRNLNYGALPLPISLLSTQTIGPSLGNSALKAGMWAGLFGFLAVVLFLIVWYRLPGLVASCALVIYVIISLVVFKLIPVTLTAAGLAGFILSIGMAVDANILIFERMKEELRKGRTLYDSIHEGFKRAWLSIRDSNISSLITALVLFWLGTSSVKGFALTLGIGVLISMFTAITVSRTFLHGLSVNRRNRLISFLFGTGFGMASSSTNPNQK